MFNDEQPFLTHPDAPGASNRRPRPSIDPRGGVSKPGCLRVQNNSGASGQLNKNRFFGVKTPGENNKICPVVKSIPFKTNKGTNKVFISANALGFCHVPTASCSTPTTAPCSSSSRASLGESERDWRPRTNEPGKQRPSEINPPFLWDAARRDYLPAFAQVPREKKENTSSSDRLPLKPTGENNTYS